MCLPQALQAFFSRGGLAPRGATDATDGLQVADDSKATDVGARYALALFDLAKDQNEIAPVESDLKALKALLRESADLRTLLGSPTFDAEAKGKGLSAVADRAGFHATTKKFLGFLAQQRRASSLASVITSFEALAAAHRGAVSAQVTTAIALTPEQAKGLQAALRQALGRDPEIETRVDPSILGGLKVRVGSRLFDASLRAKLDSLKFALKRA
jgi:F-type H+-transporting ATPase subunit delta